MRSLEAEIYIPHVSQTDAERFQVAARETANIGVFFKTLAESKFIKKAD